MEKYSKPQVTIDLAEYNELISMRAEYQQNSGTHLKISDIIFLQLLKEASQETIEKITQDLTNSGWMLEVSVGPGGPLYLKTYKHPTGGLKIIK